MRTLYFDIDGTVLLLNANVAKPALAQGGLERAIRGAGLDRLVCVGTFAGIIRTVWTLNPDYDGLGALLALCGGTFEDEAWFRGVMSLVVDPEQRAAEVDLSTDWWYMDDLAPMYFDRAGRSEIWRQERGRRILQPTPMGDGADVLDWIARLRTAAPS